MRRLALIVTLAMAVSAFATMAFGVGRPALAQEAEIATVTRLRQACLGNDHAAQAMCIGYLMGLADLLRLNGEAGRPGEMRICRPGAPSPTELALLFANWAEGNPELGDQPRQAAARAFTEAWPCR